MVRRAFACYAVVPGGGTTHSPTEASADRMSDIVSQRIRAELKLYLCVKSQPQFSNYQTK